jgi:ankyrin repeat protein
MPETGRPGLGNSDDGALLVLIQAIASRDREETADCLAARPDLATSSLRVGTNRQDPEPYFLTPLRHYVYAGDTALHVAAASHQRDLAALLVSYGARVRARNRRGAEPLHYAADAALDDAASSRSAQHDVIAFLVEAGADPNAVDRSGVAPLHRAVRNRSSSAANALISYGADPLMRNKSGSTPLHLAVQNTGKGHSGTEAAKEEQRRIIALLLECGATAEDVDANGKSVATAATNDQIRSLLAQAE